MKSVTSGEYNSLFSKEYGYYPGLASYTNLNMSMYIISNPISAARALKVNYFIPITVLLVTISVQMFTTEKMVRVSELNKPTKSKATVQQARMDYFRGGRYEEPMIIAK